MPMLESYLYYYILNSLTPIQKEENLISFNDINELDVLLNELPEYEPTEKVLEKIFKMI
jgi:hypothetical protein